MDNGPRKTTKNGTWRRRARIRGGGSDNALLPRGSCRCLCGSLRLKGNVLRRTHLSKLMIGIVFNSVPVEQVHANWGCNPVLDRVKTVIHEMRRYGVTVG